MGHMKYKNEAFDIWNEAFDIWNEAFDIWNEAFEIMSESRDTYGGGMSHIESSRVAHMNASRNRY